MTQELWSAVDEYVEGRLIEPDEVLEQALRASAEAGLPPIAVSPAQGKLLHLLARVHRAASILEVGTLGGYSTIWMARALALAPAGRMISLELNQSYAAVARSNLQRAGLQDVAEVRVGPAAEGLAALIEDRAGPFDLIFIDADKSSTPGYFAQALQLSRPGGLIIVDNVVRDGALADAGTQEAGARGMRRFHELLAAEPRVSATTIQTVGRKGYDGFTLVLVEA